MQSSSEFFYEELTPLCSRMQSSSEFFHEELTPLCSRSRVLQADKGMVCEQLKILIGRNLIKEMEPDKWVRNVLDKTTGKILLC